MHRSELPVGTLSLIQSTASAPPLARSTTIWKEVSACVRLLWNYAMPRHATPRHVTKHALTRCLLEPAARIPLLKGTEYIHRHCTVLRHRIAPHCTRIDSYSPPKVATHTQTFSAPTACTSACTKAVCLPGCASRAQGSQKRHHTTSLYVH